MKVSFAVIAACMIMLGLISSIYGKASFHYSPFQVAVSSKYQLFNKKYDIYGLRFNLLYSENNNVIGLDAGICGKSNRQTGAALNLLNVTSSDMAGLQGGLFNLCQGRMTGFQISGGNYADFLRGIQIGLSGNICGPYKSNSSDIESSGLQIGLVGNGCDGTFQGMQLSAMMNVSHEEFTGAQICFLLNYSNSNWKEEPCKGIQIGSVNLTGVGFIGVQIGGVNSTPDALRGLQIGLLNSTGELHGIQIGLLNFAKQAQFPFMILVNFGK